MKSRAGLATVALALSALVACKSGVTPSPPAAAEYQEVTLSSADGLRLNGRLFGEGERAVVLAHMFPADQESWRAFATDLAERGYLALTFDFRGYGSSEGPREISEIALDVEGALNFLEKRDVQDVYLVGASVVLPI